jgi:Ser/Thr protein kinase RdoA (MazF antagonist)
LDERQFGLWGRNLGALHYAGRGFATTGRPAWSDHILFARRTIPASEENALRELHAISGVLSKLPNDCANYSLIHYDFELDNIVWKNENAGILDFDDCVFHWHEGDIAFALRDLFDNRVEKVDFNCNRFAAFLKGYRSAKGIDDQAIQRIPLFLRLHNLILFARLIYCLSDEFEHDLSTEPEWARNLRRKLEGVMDKCRDGFRNHPIDDFLKLWEGATK